MQRTYIPAANLPHLDAYAYSGVDHSIVSKYILQPYWNRFVLLFPPYVAPNVITFLGLLCVVANVATLIYYNPALDGECPRWVYFSWALGLFLYQTLDGVDGKQARRTGTSGPLGQLFDHGCDALNVTLVALLAAETSHLGGSWYTVIGLCGGLFNFYVSTWEEYHTGTLFLSAFSGPVEGLLLIILSMVVTGFTGPAFWDNSLAQIASLAGLAIPASLPLVNTPVKLLMLFASQITIVFNLYFSAINIRKALADRAQSSKAKAKVTAHHHHVNPALHRVLGRLLPSLHIPALLAASIYLQPSLLHGRLLVPLILYMGFASSYFVGRMIVAHVTVMRFPRGNYILVPWIVHTALLAARHYLPPATSSAKLLATLTAPGSEPIWVLSSLAWGASVYFWFAYRVTNDICLYKDIWCFRIKYYGQQRPKKE